MLRYAKSTNFENPATFDPRHPRYEYHYDGQGRRTRLVSHVYGEVGQYSNRVTYVNRDSEGDETTVWRTWNEAWPDDEGSVTEFGYDNEGRQISRTLPAGQSESSVYAASDGDTHKRGQLLYQIDFEGRVTAYLYDTLPTAGGRVDEVRYFETFEDYDTDEPPARTVSYTYDALGRQVEMDDSEFGTPTTYEYDADGQLITIESPQGMLHYAYDDLGRKIATWTGSETTLEDARDTATTLTEYEYDDLNRLIRTTAVRRFDDVVPVDPEQTETVFTLDGQIDYELTTMDDGTLTKDHVYDSQGRVEKFQHFADTGSTPNHQFDTGETLLGGFVYTYNKDNTRASETWTNEDGQVTTIEWTYDHAGRIWREEFEGYNSAGGELEYIDTFKHDVSGNRIETGHVDVLNSGPNSTTKYRYDSNDRLVIEHKNAPATNDSRWITYAYTHGGDGTEQETKEVHVWQSPSTIGALLETTTYTYDVMGRMTEVEIDDGSPVTVSYRYDANGFKVEQTTGSNTTIYHIDPANPTGYSQVLEEGLDDDTADGELQSTEVDKTYTLASRILTQATDAQALHLLTDARNSTRAVVDLGDGPTTGAVDQHYAYNVNGLDLGLTGTILTDTRYVGEKIDPITGLSFNRARWYDLRQGRFMTLDPYSGDSRSPVSFNKYLYGNANPVNASDPTGMFSLLEILVTLNSGELPKKFTEIRRTHAAGVTVSKMLVRFALLNMDMLTRELPPTRGPKHLLVTGYYLYSWLAFEKAYKRPEARTRLALKSHRLAKYLAGLPGGADKLREAEYERQTNPTRFLADGVKNIGKTASTFIPYTGTRTRDYQLAMLASMAHEAFKLGTVSKHNPKISLDHRQM